MLRLVYANQLDALAGSLAERVAAVQTGTDPLRPISVWVRNPAAAAYLKLAVARHLGIAAHLQLGFARADLAKRILPLDGALRLLSRDRLEVLLLDVLSQDGLLDDPALEAVRRYLSPREDDPVGRERRRIQLAARLAVLFDRYGLERPEMIESWSRGETNAPREAWQAAIWRALRLEEHGLGPITRALTPEVAARIEWPNPLLLFDVPMFQRGIARAVDLGARHTDIDVFALNPCREFWEDFTPDTPAALRVFGAAGRTETRTLNELAGFDFEARFEDPPADPSRTLLGAFRHRVTTRKPDGPPPGDAPAYDDDASIRASGSASIRRELERIAQEIWRTVHRPDRPPSFDRIAVVLAGRDAERYRALLPAVFAEHHDIPHHLLDIPLSATSRVLEAVELLLGLPLSDFSRDALLRLVTHDNVLQDAPAASRELWPRWCETLGIIRGADRTDLEGTYVEKDLLTWNQGVLRLVLGGFAPTGAFVDLGAEAYLPAALGTNELECAGELVALVRSLVADARWAARTRLTVDRWAAFFRSWVRTYLKPASEADERDLYRVMRALEELEGTPGVNPVSFLTASDLALRRLRRLSQNRGQPLAEAVVVGSLELLAPIPFDTVFLPGLGEGLFPVADPPAGLDLLARDPRPADVSPRDRDLYRFLLRILATQHRLRISWVAREQESGDTLLPSPAVQALFDILETNELGRSKMAAHIDHPPLRRYDRSETPSPFDPVGVHREREARALRGHLLEHLGVGPVDLERSTFLREGPRGAVYRVAPHLESLERPPEDAAPISPPRPETVRIASLRRFLEDPREGWARAALRLSERDLETDPFAREDELFRTERQEETAFLQDVFFCAPGTPDGLAARYRARAEHRERCMEGPTGVFQRAEARRHHRVLEGWRAGLDQVTFGLPAHRFAVAFGSMRHGDLAMHARPPVEIHLGDRTVRLVGRTAPLLDSPRALIVAIVRPDRSNLMGLQDELRAFVDHLLLSADTHPNTELASYILYGDGRVREVRFMPVSREIAETYLSRLTGALFSHDHDFELPFRTIALLHRHRDRRPAELRRLFARNRRGRPGVLTPGVLRPAPGPPPLERAIQILEDRYALFFQLRSGAAP